jgi:uncharacterized phage protein gp47/JayE
LAQVPTPRSYSQILGDSLDALLSRLGLPSLRVGSPILSIIEAASQSDLRNSQDIFAVLNAQSLDRADKQALDRIGADEDLPRIGESSSSGIVTISDSAITKKETVLFQGKPAPIVGSVTIYLADASSFSTVADGEIYVGRGTTNYEGPLSYTGLPVNSGNYWTLSLAPGSYTKKYHNLGETVVLAQGGNRSIPAGSVVETALGNAGSPVQFGTLYAATIPDGEVSVTGVTVICKTPGLTGNVIAGSINSFPSAPFTGAVVTNPTPFSNGLSTENDDVYRERIRAVRQSRSKGTALAIKTAITGITALDENKRVISSSIVTRTGYPTTLYLDDGTGYEEKSEGISIETIVDEALGGEQYFQLANGRPVSKAFVETSLTAPFSLQASMRLDVKVGGVLSGHSFTASEFRSIASASAYEVTASINNNSELLFSARTTASGTKVALFAKSDTNEDIEVLIPDTSYTDANPFLGFPAGKVDTLRLYKNDKLLTKDGKIASVVSQSQGLWQTTSDGATLEIIIDGVSVGSNIYVFSNSDFVNAGTGYVSVSANNSLESWVKVLNYKLPGVTAKVVGGAISLTSNRGRSSSASIEVLGGTISTSSGIFSVTDGAVTGSDFDYTLDRNLGQIRLEDSLILAAGDKLSASSYSTRAFIESGDMTVLTTTSTSELWFVVDGGAVIIPSSIAPSSQATVTRTVANPDIVTVTITSGFTNALAGDWVIITDPALNVGNRGAWRISSRTDNSVTLELPAGVAVAEGPISLITGGVSVVRTEAQLQKVSLSAGSYTATSIVSAINSVLVGGTASVYRQRVRVRTNRFLGGDIALVAANSEGLKFLMSVTSSTPNETPHLATVEVGNFGAGTPQFDYSEVTTSGTTSSVILSAIGQFDSGSIVAGLRSFAGSDYYGNKGAESPISLITGTTLTLRDAAVQSWLDSDRLYAASPYALTGYDNLTVVVDGDTSSKRFVCPMYRKLTPGNNTYGATNAFYDKDNSDAILPKAFGVGMDWEDFAVVMPARAKSHRVVGVDATNTILWRYKRLGADGNKARIQYVYPTAPSLTSTATATATVGNYVNVGVTLPSGPARAIAGEIVSASKIGGYASATPDGSGLYTRTFILNVTVGSVSRDGAGVVTITTTLPSGATGHGFSVGDTFFVEYNGTGTGAGFTTGLKTAITGTSSTTTTLKYQDTAGVIGATANAGEVSAGVKKDVLPTTVQVDDIFYANSGTSLNSIFKEALRVDTKTTAYFTAKSPVWGDTSGIILWGAINQLSNVSWYPISGNTTVAISAAINAQTSSPVSALAIGVGGVNTGVVSYASYEATELGNTTSDTPWYHLTDGINYIRDAVAPLASDTLTNTLRFKDSIGDLATNSDWLNEDIRIVPITAKNTVDYLNTSGPGGLFASALVELSDKGRKPQITSISIGSEGSIQVQGGTANSVTSAVKGNAVQVSGTPSDYLVANVNYSDTVGLSAGHWMSLDNSVRINKSRVTASTVLSSIVLDGGTTGTATITFSGTKAYNILGTTHSLVKNVTVENHGKFTYYASDDLDFVLAAVNEGDWVVVNSSAVATPADRLSSRNCGTFRVVRKVSSGTKMGFWVENPIAYEESNQAFIQFFAYDSIMPGDTLSINTTLWGANIGNWTVTAINASIYNTAFTGNTEYSFKVDVTQAAMIAVGAPVAALGASRANLVQIVEANPGRLIKKIRSVSQHPTDSSLAEVKFESWYGGSKVGEASGTILTALDKLNFPESLSIGADGYRHTTGLIAEANKVGYGDERDSASYPGVIAAGAKVNIEGPLIRRVQVSLSLRIRTGISARDIKNQVKSAVASAVNGTGVGIPVAISDLVTAAQSVNGVISVSVISPSFGVGSDLISIQPFEKPYVLDIDNDIVVTFVGE